MDKPLIRVFGNPDLPEDSLPVRLIPELEEALPEYRFRFTDPNELDLPEEHEDFVALDTVDGLKDVREISIEEVAELKARTTAHDYDLASFLLLVKKLRPNIRIRIIGVPMEISSSEALEKITSLLRKK